MSLINFNAQGVPPATGELEPIPAAWYDVAMDQSEMKPTKDAATTGNAFLECRFNVLSGQYAGRKLYSRLNIKNNNPVASEIAYKELSAICHAVGIMQVQDSQQLHGIPLKVKVKIRPGDDKYGAANDITTFKPANFVPDAPAGAAQVPGMPVMAPGAVAPPMGMPPAQQGWAPPPMQQQPMQQAPQQPWAQPGTQPPAQPWAQQPQMQPPPMQQPPVQQPMQQPAAPQQPWQQPAQQAPQQPWTQAPAQQPAQQPAPQQQQPAAPQQQWPAGGDPQQAVPPWQRTN